VLYIIYIYNITVINLFQVKVADCAQTSRSLINNIARSGDVLFAYSCKYMHTTTSLILQCFVSISTLYNNILNYVAVGFAECTTVEFADYWIQYNTLSCVCTCVCVCAWSYYITYETLFQIISHRRHYFHESSSGLIYLPLVCANTQYSYTLVGVPHALPKTIAVIFVSYCYCSRRAVLVDDDWRANFIESRPRSIIIIIETTWYHYLLLTIRVPYLYTQGIMWTVSVIYNSWIGIYLLYLRVITSISDIYFSDKIKRV
jgi:hypothetical protein